MLNAKKLIQLSEEVGQEKFKAEIGEMFGVVKQADGTKKYDASKAGIDAKNVSIQEIAMEFGGFPTVHALSRHLLEAGGQVMPSNFAHINAYTDTISGLLDAIVLKGYQAVEFIGKELIGTRQTRRNGGKDIDITLDGQLKGEIPLGVELPSLGLSETWVTYPVNKRWGSKIEINKYDFIYDRTDKIQREATNTGYLTGYQVETAIAQTVLGITNSYKRLDTANNTYQTSAGASPFTYVNQLTNALLTYNNINLGHILLQKNYDPTTGLEISIPTPSLLVMPQNQIQGQALIRATEINSYSVAGTTNFPSTRTTFTNPMSGYDLKVASMLWYNLLVKAAASGGEGASTTNAAARWHIGDFSRAFKWLIVLPFQTWSAPLSSADMAKGVSLVYLAEECGVPVVEAPEYAGKMTLE